jgi:hypothetical protein
VVRELTVRFDRDIIRGGQDETKGCSNGKTNFGEKKLTLRTGQEQA